MTLADQIEQMKNGLTVAKFAEMMNVSKKLVYKMLKRKSGLVSYKICGIIRLDPVLTAQWLRSHAVGKSR
jgi:Mn-dependent DtxR family transcriptional regulator